MSDRKNGDEITVTLKGVFQECTVCHAGKTDAIYDGLTTTQRPDSVLVIMPHHSGCPVPRGWR